MICRFDTGDRAAATSPWVKPATPAALQGTAVGQAFGCGKQMKTDIEAIVAEYARRYEPLIRVEEAAEIARAPIGTIHAWSSYGRMDGFKVRAGRRVLFHRDAFVRFVLGGNAAGG